MALRHLKRLLTAVAGLTTTTMPALASSDSAWKEFDQRVTRSCMAASGFRNARASVILGFDDRAGKVAQLISDRTRRSTRSKLCLYDKRTRTAFINDADMWSAPPAPAPR